MQHIIIPKHNQPYGTAAYKNEGHGSGLNADLLDGKHADEFALAEHTHEEFNLTLTWDRILNKPTTFPIEPHTHSWEQIQNKPTVFPPSTHTHPADQIIGLEASLTEYVKHIEYTDNHILTKIKNVHGHGSGLDADLLDGKHANELALANHQHPEYLTPSWTSVQDKPTTFPPDPHTHSWTAITGKPTTFPPEQHEHTWTEITGKPIAYPPAPHTHPEYNSIGWDNVSDKPTTFPPTEHSHTWSSITGKPTSFTPSAHTHTWLAISDKPYTFPPAIHEHTWVEIGNKPVVFPPENHTHPEYVNPTWDTLEGKPSTFPPEPHTHTYASITSKPSTFPPDPHDHTWTSITGKPSTYPPSAHTHAWEAIADKPATFPMEPHAHSWSDITGKPATYPPSPHEHEQYLTPDWNNITNKPTTFPPSTHTHAWVAITGKPSTYPPSTHTHSEYDITWDTLSGKPTSFTPAVHVHSWNDISNKPSTFTPSAHVHTYDSITDKPTTFNPSAHTHTWASIEGKPSTFTPSAHTHSWTEITDKPTTYPPEEHTHPEYESSPVYVDPLVNVTESTTLCKSAHISFEPLNYQLANINNRYQEAAVGIDGKIYALPYSTTQVLEFDPISKEIKTYGGYSTNLNKWKSTVAHPNGKIYGIPYNSDFILEFDPITKSSVYILSGARESRGFGVLANNNKIYVLPGNSTSILEIDPRTRSYTTFTAPTGYEYGALAPNGKIYALNSATTANCLVIDPSTKTTSVLTITATAGVTKGWSGIACGTNGKLYGVPSTTGSHIIEIDPTDNSYTFKRPATGMWGKAIAVGTDTIFACSLSGTTSPHHFIYNYIDDTLDLSLTTNTNSEVFMGPVEGPNDCIYLMPYTQGTTVVAELHPALSYAVDGVSVSDVRVMRYGTYQIDSGHAWRSSIAYGDWIYAPPRSTQIGVWMFNTVTKQLKTVGLGSAHATDQYGSIALGADKNLYCIPRNSSHILKIDTNTQIPELLTDIPVSAEGNKWSGVIPHPNGKLYGVPRDATAVLEFDPITRTTALFGDITGLQKFSPGCLGPDKLMYAMPYNTAAVLEINPNRSIQLRGAAPAISGATWGTVLAPNGMLYGIPHNSQAIYKFDPVTKILTTIPLPTTTATAYIGGTLALDGLIYCWPYLERRVLIINPEDDSFEFVTLDIDIPSNLPLTEGGCMGPDGNLYSIAAAGQLVIKPFSKNKVAWAMSPYFNKT